MDDIPKFGDRRIDITPATVAGALFEIHEKVDALIERQNKIIERLEGGSGGCDIPSDFPARDILIDNGIDSLCELAEVEDFTELERIGPARADELEQALANI